MRKYKYKQVENYINLFRKITEGVAIELAPKKYNAAKASEYLQVAQQKAIDFGTFIEGEEGLGHPTVTVLEEFCEILYQINEEIISENGLSADSAKLRLESIINKIEKSAKEDIVITKLVVFLPYKASMWDSLESVWLKENADENTTALVIPIPYFDRNPDGSMKEMHYEGNDYPENVPITSYEDFDFGAEHPDEIYIHVWREGITTIDDIDVDPFRDETIPAWLDIVNDCREELNKRGYSDVELCLQFITDDPENELVFLTIEGGEVIYFIGDEA